MIHETSGGIALCYFRERNEMSHLSVFAAAQVSLNGRFGCGMMKRPERASERFANLMRGIAGKLAREAASRISRRAHVCYITLEGALSRRVRRAEAAPGSSPVLSLKNFPPPLHGAS
jgi:hypothetical protein